MQVATKIKQRIKQISLIATTLVSTAAAPTLYGQTAAVHAAPETAKSADAFVDTIGVNVHLTYGDTAYANWGSIIKPRLQELGIRHIRDGGFYSTEYFNKLHELADLGIKSNLIFFGTPTGEVVGIAKLLKGVIEAVEGPNETDLGFVNFSYNGQKFPEATRAYQKDLYTAIKNDPETNYLPVIMPSMGHGENALLLGYLEWGDIGNMHSYPNLGERPTYDIDWYFIFHARTIAGTTKPLMSTETGYHNMTSDAVGISETAASKYIPRLLLEYFNRNIKRTYLYELIDQHPDPNNSDKEQHYGLLRNDGSTKPAYIAIKNLISLLKEPGAKFTPGSLDYTLSGDTTDVHHTLVQKGTSSNLPSRFFLVVWQDARSWDSTSKKDIPVTDSKVTLNLNTNISRVTVYQPLNSINPILDQTSLSNGRINQLTLNVPDHPLVIRLIP